MPFGRCRIVFREGFCTVNGKSSYQMFWVSGPIEQLSVLVRRKESNPTNLDLNRASRDGRPRPSEKTSEFNGNIIPDFDNIRRGTYYVPTKFYQN